MQDRPLRKAHALDVMSGIIANSRRYGTEFFPRQLMQDICRRYEDHPILQEAGIYRNAMYMDSSEIDVAIQGLLQWRFCSQRIPSGEFVPRGGQESIREFWEKYNKTRLEENQAAQIEALAKDLDMRQDPENEPYVAVS